MTILSAHRIALLGSTVALAFASLGGVAQAKHGADDGAAHHRHHHHAKHHHHHHHAEPRDDR
jgi:hypothetical protein